MGDRAGVGMNARPYNGSGKLYIYTKVVKDLELTYNATLKVYGHIPSFYNHGEMDTKALRSYMQKRNIRIDLEELESNSTSINFFEQGALKITGVISGQSISAPLNLINYTKFH